MRGSETAPGTLSRQGGRMPRPPPRCSGPSGTWRQRIATRSSSKEVDGEAEPIPGALLCSPLPYRHSLRVPAVDLLAIPLEVRLHAANRELLVPMLQRVEDPEVLLVVALR